MDEKNSSSMGIEWKGVLILKFHLFDKYKETTKSLHASRKCHTRIGISLMNWIIFGEKYKIIKFVIMCIYITHRLETAALKWF